MKSLIVGLLFLSGALHAFAAEVTISLFPLNPEPNASVTLTLVSYDIDVDTAMVTWKVNNKEVLKSIGAKKLTLQTGPVGTKQDIIATVVDSFGNHVIASMALAPQSVTVLWESVESHVPPFYEGKALPGEGSQVRLVAIPATTESPKNLSFGWYINDEYSNALSGSGKQSAIVRLDPLLEESQILSRVRTSKGVSMEKTITIVPHKIMPVFYSYDEVLGTNYAAAFSRRVELGKDITLSLVPYYLSTRGSFGESAGYTWFVDGLPIEPQEKTLLTLRPKANTYGARMLSILVDNTKRRLQEAEERLEIVFDTR